MITTFLQAHRIQLNRVVQGKIGHAHAVRRFLKRGLGISRMKGTGGNHILYLERKAELPCIDGYGKLINFGE